MARDDEKRRRRREEQPEREESSRAERAQQSTGRPAMQREDTQPTGAPSWMQGGQQRTGVDAYGQSATGMPQGGAGIMREPREGAPGFGVQADGVDGTEPQLPIEPMGKAARHIGEKEIADAAETLRKY